MDIFGLSSSRHVSMAERRTGALTQSRDESLEAVRHARKQREILRDKQNANLKIKTFVVSRYRHKKSCNVQRSSFDQCVLEVYNKHNNNNNNNITLSAIYASTASTSNTLPPLTCEQLHALLSQFLFFYNPAQFKYYIHDIHYNNSNSNPAPSSSSSSSSTPSTHPSSSSSAYLTTGYHMNNITDLQRYNFLKTHLLLSFKSNSLSHHYGSMLLSTKSSSSSSSSSKSSHSLQFLHELNIIGYLCLLRISNVHIPLAQLHGDIMLLWHIVDVAQWQPFKLSNNTNNNNITQATISSITAIQYRLLRSWMESTYRLSRKSQHIDMFQSLRARLTDMTRLERDNTVSPQQLAHKTSVALIMAILIKSFNLIVQQCPLTPSTPSAPLPYVYSSFLYHIFSIPALAHRFKAFGLQALSNSFTINQVWNAIMNTIIKHIDYEHNNSSSSSSSTSSCSLPTFSFHPKHFNSISYTAHDADMASLPPLQLHQLVSSSATDVASSSSTSTVSTASSITSSSSSSSSSSSGSVPMEIDELDDDRLRSIRRFQASCYLKFPLTLPIPISGWSWILSNSIDMFMSIDESKQPAQISLFLAAMEKLVLQLPQWELPHAVPAIHAVLPPILIQSFNQFSDKKFLNRFTSLLFRSKSSSAATSSELLDDASSICVIIDTILFKWSTASNTILNTLVFSTNIVTSLWHSIEHGGLLQRIEELAQLKYEPYLLNAPSASTPATSTAASTPTHPFDALISDHRLFASLPLFATCYTHLLLILDDDDFYLNSHPFSLSTNIRMVCALKVLLRHCYWEGWKSVNTRLRERLTELFVQLRHRQTRKSFMSTEQWLIPELNAKDIENEIKDDPTGRAQAILTHIPFVLSFSDRVKFLYAHIDADRHSLSDSVNFAHGMGTHIRIHRKTILEDGYQALTNLGQQLKGRIQVEFYDENNVLEPGLDGGGLFKEFLISLLKSSFDPAFGLWKQTANHFLFPHPDSLTITALNSAEQVTRNKAYYFFFGQMMGKALYDGITIDTQFALFFLRLTLGEINYRDDLIHYDPAYHANLMKLKTMDTDVSELGLFFTVDKEEYGVMKTVELIHGGANIPVTNDNKMRFIYAVSDYYLNKQIAVQAQCFIAGMCTVIDRTWLRLFTAEEIRLLICGSEQIDIGDLQTNTNYAGGYTANHELIRWYWEIVQEMSMEDVGNLLKFVTSCSRTPLLGFGSLTPKFGIQRVNVADESEMQLPTSATCMNLLRLPRYSSKARLKDRLLYAIRSGAGFGLT